MNQFDSYLYGLILTDGSIHMQSRNRGRITIELRKEDIDLLRQLQTKVPDSIIRTRIRDTNFKKDYHSAIFANYRKDFRDKFITYGIPLHDKQTTGTIPKTNYSENDFWRGVYDGNGSLGFTNANEPFISLVTKSEPLKNELCTLLRNRFNIRKNIKTNKRDKVFNIVLKNEDALRFCDFLYMNADIYMQRKYDIYLDISKWVRTKKKINQQSWSDEEIAYIQNHTVQESATHLNRTEQSIKMKLWRLRQSNNH